MCVKVWGLPGTWYLVPGTCPQMRISVEQEVFYWIFSPFFGFEHIFRNRFCVVVLFIIFTRAHVHTRGHLAVGRVSDSDLFPVIFVFGICVISCVLNCAKHPFFHEHMYKGSPGCRKSCRLGLISFNFYLWYLC